MLRSRIFYGWWNWLHVPLLLASIAFTFLAAQAIQQKVLAGQTDRANVITMVAILANLVLLAYFKYAHFIVQSLTTALGLEYSDPIQIALPLGISFYTFTQIAFLVDTHRGKAAEYRPANYALFVTYFPHLIAGPILHHREMMPQFERAGKNKNTWPDLAAGLTILFFGLFKKTVLADGVAPYATAAFDAAASGHPLTLLESWGGALAYTFQIYFDFSGYTDMAIGLSLMLGIRLPQNFYSPYKATNIIEFWRRWHMTLSRFLREYVYIPLGGNRRGEARRYANLAATMAIGGLWHGAAWTFVIWGVLHGCYLTLNHFWRAITQHRFSPRTRRLFRPFGWLLTFVAVVIAWVFFRANDVSTAWEFLRSMAGLNGVVFPSQWETHLGGVPDWLRPGGFAFGDLQYFNRSSRFNRLVLFLLIVTLAPNTHQIMAACNPTTALPFAASSPRFFVLTWRPSLLWMLVALGIGLFGVTSITGFSEFIYFNF